MGTGFRVNARSSRWRASSREAGPQVLSVLEGRPCPVASNGEAAVPSGCSGALSTFRTIESAAAPFRSVGGGALRLRSGPVAPALGARTHALRWPRRFLHRPSCIPNFGRVGGKRRIERPRPMTVCFPPLIKPDRRFSRIRLSEFLARKHCLRCMGSAFGRARIG
jgi:hypothetical protein